MVHPRSRSVLFGDLSATSVELRQRRDADNDPANGKEYETSKVFLNYDVSFHNELWASAFFGNFASGNTWHWERVFWWLDALPEPEPDTGPLGNQWQPLGVFSNAPGVTNLLDPDIGFGVPIVNKPVHHNFKPLADMLANADWLTYDFFNGDINSHKVYDDANGIECYYLVNDAGSLAIGWVHNLNAYWENQYYIKRSKHDFLGCTAPSAQMVSLPGFLSSHDLDVTWFPTRMNSTVYPVDATVTTSTTGTLTLDLGTAPLGGTLNNYLDTLHADYAFIVAPQFVVKSADGTDGYDTTASAMDWDFSMYPNPAAEVLNLLLPGDEGPRDITIFDMNGRRLYSLTNVTTRSVVIPTGSLARGAYGVRVTDGVYSKIKTLILR